jgi:hypothetical protein
MTFSDEELEARIATLEQQQSFQTNAIRAALEARWSGEADTVTGWLIALDPSLEGELNPQTPLYPDG